MEEYPFLDGPEPDAQLTSHNKILRARYEMALGQVYGTWELIQTAVQPVHLQ
jgi:hypothetical protein